MRAPPAEWFWCASMPNAWVVFLGDEVVADHPRHFQRDKIIYDPWHYLPVLMKKPAPCATARHSKTGICRPR